MTGSADSAHFLLTSLGLRCREATYELAGRRATAAFAPLALWQLLPAEARPRRVVVLASTGARKATFADFAGAAVGLGLEVERCDVPDGPGEAAGLLACAAERIPPGCRLTLDVTHGLRHHAFLFYALTLYLTGLRGVTIEGVWYGMLESGTVVDPKPYLDLRPVLALGDWFHAVRAFREQGTALPIADLVRKVAEHLRAQAAGAGHDQALHRRARSIEALADNLRATSFAYESALALELGRAARLLTERVAGDAFVDLAPFVPLAGELVGTIREAAAPLAVGTAPPSKGKWKEAIPLGDDELARQRDLIARYLERGQFSLALGLMREWVVSWIVLHRGRPNQWLQRQERERAEQTLGALAAYAREPGAAALPAGTREWGRFWSQLTDLRNAMHHHGMGQDEVTSADPRLHAVRDFWTGIAHRPPPEFGGGRGRLLISAQGANAGALFSALRTSRPARCLVICSRESEDSVVEAARRAEFEGKVVPLVMSDPYAGSGEIAGLVRRAEEEILHADEVDANLTGGTTIMGIAVQELMERARALDRPTRRFALIDKRPRSEQYAEPWVQSEAYWLDGPTGENHARD